MAPLQRDYATKALQKVQTVLTSLITALLIFCFKFLWSINAILSAQAITNQDNSAAIADMKQKVEFLQNANADAVLRLTKIESKTDKLQNNGRVFK